MKLKDLQAALSNPETVNKVVASKTSAVASNRTKAPDQSRAAKTGGLSVLAENDNSFAASKGATQRDTLKFFAPKISTAAKEAAKEQEQRTSMAKASEADDSSRISKVFKAGVKASAADFTEIHAQLSKPTGELTLGESAQGDVRGDTAKRISEKTQRQKDYQSSVYATADELTKQSQKEIQGAKEGLGFLGSTLVDLGVNGTQMLGDLAVAALTGGSALIPMVARSYGDYAKQARQEGKNEWQQVLSGAKGATIEGVTERMFDGLSGLYGKGGATEIVKDFSERVMKTELGAKFVAKALEAGGEGVEEIVSDVVNPIANKLLGLSEAGAPLYTKDDAKQMLYDGFVGALMGVAGTAVGDVGTAVKTAVGDRVVGSSIMQNDQHAALVGAALQYREGSKTKALADQINQKLSAETYTGGDAFNGVTEAEFGKLQRTAAEELEQYGPTTQTPTQRAAVAQTVNPDAHVMSPIAAEFQSAGLTADEAVRRGDVLDRLLSIAGPA
jgi:hypothetical protein